jgi:muramoyltetrapeptide carboxypeptidase
MIATDLASGVTARAAERLCRLLAGADAAWSEPVGEVLAPGVGTGRAVGGCLASLTALLGTPYAVETEGAVLFLEDVAERPFRIDRMLTHLQLAGKLDGVVAVVLGAFSSPGGREDDALTDVFRDFFSAAPYPVVAGFPAGHHLADNLTFAFGLPLTVDTTRGVVEAGAA